jgi:hypothetical protein
MKTEYVYISEYIQYGSLVFTMTDSDNICLGFENAAVTGNNGFGVTLVTTKRCTGAHASGMSPFCSDKCLRRFCGVVFSRLDGVPEDRRVKSATAITRRFLPKGITRNDPKYHGDDGNFYITSVENYLFDLVREFTITFIPRTNECKSLNKANFRIDPRSITYVPGVSRFTHARRKHNA